MKYGVWFYERGWLKDTCAGGAYTGKCDDIDRDVDQAKQWDSPQEALIEIEACDIEGRLGWDYEVVPL